MMARRIALLSASLVLFLTAPTLSDPPDANPVAHKAGANITSLPASLDALYPPRSKPVLLLAMHELNASLAGIVADLLQNDPDGARTNFETFRTKYAEISDLVPEWKTGYPSAPVEALGKALSSGSQDEVMQAIGQMGSVCHQCHLQTMVAVQLQYHWPDFSRVSVHDPVADSDDELTTFMMKLNVNLTGVANDLKQGQIENARAHASQLQLRMAELRESCAACHDTDRAYFIDDGIMDILNGMSTALEAPDVDPSVIAKAGQRLGQESCFRCHLVHLPAAYAQAIRNL